MFHKKKKMLHDSGVMRGIVLTMALCWLAFMLVSMARYVMYEPTLMRGERIKRFERVVLPGGRVTYKEAKRQQGQGED